MAGIAVIVPVLLLQIPNAAGGRIGPPAGRRDRRDWGAPFGVGGQGRNRDDARLLTSSRAAGATSRRRVLLASTAISVGRAPRRRSICSRARSTISSGRDTPEFCHSDYYNAKDCIAIRGYDFPVGLPVGLSPLIRGAAGGRRLCLPDGRRCRSLSGRLDLGFGELAPQIC